MSIRSIPNLLVSCFLSCMPCMAQHEAPAQPSTYCVPISQKVHRAAFDLGSGLFKMVVAEIDPETKLVNQILLEKIIVSDLGDDFKKHGTISSEGEAKVVKALEELVELAKRTVGEHVEMKGVATATFRKAGTRGAEVLSRLNAIAGSQEFVQEITAQTEGQIGLRTARIVALENDPQRSLPNIAWDSGNASFQVSYETEKGIEVFLGNIGGSDVKALFVTEILGQPQYDVYKMGYQPVSQNQIQQFVHMLKARFPDPNENLQKILVQEKGRVVTIGDGTSIFSLMQALLGKNIYSKADVEEILMSLSNRTDLNGLQAKYPTNIAFIVPLTAFLYAVMDKLNIDSVENYITNGITKGLLVTPELWSKRNFP